jgi:hypothetical protein
MPPCARLVLALWHGSEGECRNAGLCWIHRAKPDVRRGQLAVGAERQSQAGVLGQLPIETIQIAPGEEAEFEQRAPDQRLEIARVPLEHLDGGKWDQRVRRVL